MRVAKPLHPRSAGAGRWIVALLLALGGACGGKESGPSEPVPTALVIGPHGAILRLGQSRALAAMVLDQHADTLPDPVTWSSLDPSVATVDGVGLVASVTVGAARIVATSGSLADTATLTVTLVPIVSIVATLGEDSLMIEDSTTVTVVAYDSAGGVLVGRTLSIFSADAEVLSVSPDGVVRVVEYGTGRVVAAGEGHADTVTAVVHLRFTKLYVGYDGACGLTAGGLAYCWGYNSVGQYGGPTGNLLAPRRLPGQVRFSSLEPAEYTGSTCGVATNGAGWCWGQNAFGQLGGGSTGGETGEPQQVAGGHQFSRIESGYSSYCGVDTDARIWCWGARTYGAWGDSLASGVSATPVLAAGGRHFSVYTMGWRQSCGISNEDGYTCWGANRSGTFGAGDTTSSLVPRSIATGLTFTALHGEFDNMCGIAAGALYCWGFNLGDQVGDGTTTERHSPVAIGAGIAFDPVPASIGPDCAVAADGKGYCWGYQLSPIPLEVPLAGGWATLSAGDRFKCGLGLDGLAYCFGGNVNGRLGVGDPSPDLVLEAPTRVAGQ